MSISSLFQFVIGFFLGLIFFTAGIAGGAYFFLNQTAANPEKQVFSEEKPEPTPEETTAEEKPESTTAQTQPEKTATKPQPQPEKLPDGAYLAKVTWSTGLSLREQPSRDAQRIGGVGYNSEIIILSTSNDGDWQKIRIPGSQQEGWVKAGNVAKVTDE